MTIEPSRRGRPDSALGSPGRATASPSAIVRIARAERHRPPCRDAVRDPRGPRPAGRRSGRAGRGRSHPPMPGAPSARSGRRSRPRARPPRRRRRRVRISVPTLPGSATCQSASATGALLERRAGRPGGRSPITRGGWASVETPASSSAPTSLPATSRSAGSIPAAERGLDEILPLADEEAELRRAAAGSASRRTSFSRGFDADVITVHRNVPAPHGLSRQSDPHGQVRRERVGRNGTRRDRAGLGHL